ncbi:MAG: chorismate mutase [Planctomycetaceae bacterium]
MGCADKPEEILAATSELLQEILRANESTPKRSPAFFTTTSDLTSCFPANSLQARLVAVVPLLCATEIPVPGSSSCARYPDSPPSQHRQTPGRRWNTSTSAKPNASAPTSTRRSNLKWVAQTIAQRQAIPVAGLHNHLCCLGCEAYTHAGTSCQELPSPHQIPPQKMEKLVILARVSGRTEDE